MEWSNKCQKAGSDKVYTFIRWDQRAPLAEDGYSNYSSLPYALAQDEDS